MKSLGVQLYTIRDFLGSAEEIKKSFTRLKEMGYDEVQTAGVSIDAAEYGKIAKETGIKVVGTHMSLNEIMNDTEKVIEDHRLYGTTNIGVGGMEQEYRYSREKILEYIKNVNAVADIIYKAGMKFTYHNHSFEFTQYDGKSIFDMLIDGFDSEKTSFVMDTYWVHNAGGDVCEWIEKLKGRIDILHLKDMGVTNGENKSVYREIGYGNLNFKKIIPLAEKCGVKSFVVEQDTCIGDPFECLKRSSDYIHANFFEK